MTWVLALLCHLLANSRCLDVFTFKIEMIIIITPTHGVIVRIK